MAKPSNKPANKSANNGARKPLPSGSEGNAAKATALLLEYAKLSGEQEATEKRLQVIATELHGLYGSARLPLPDGTLVVATVRERDGVKQAYMRRAESPVVQGIVFPSAAK